MQAQTENTVMRPTDKLQTLETRFELKLSKWVLAAVGIFYLIAVIAELLVAANLIQAQPVANLWDASKTILLPIVTLIMGHYFGTKTESTL